MAGGAQKAEWRSAGRGTGADSTAARAYPACFCPKKMEIFNDFPGKIKEKFQVFKSKSIKKIRRGGPETGKRL